MKIQIEIDKDSIIQTSVDYLKRAITFCYKWLTNEGEALGYILGHIHFMLFSMLVTLVILSHTVYPNFWLQLALFCVIFIVWAQHIFLKVCVSIVAEQELTQKRSPFHELLENVFQISTDDFINYFVVTETTALGCLGLELISRVCIYLGGWSSQL
jgi:hypothetical protein